ncbi:MAG: prepilin-type N-terminal cleavage/methylation domain-containing protein [Phycisphaerae bacterium]|nr:prepilin-type N-terminal cleavage/methylation domain-containing protein [Phycisphaerae bacterium]
MRLRAFTMLEVLLVIALMGLLMALVYPSFDSDRRHRSLTESAERLRALIEMAHAKAMQEGIRYRISFPGTPDPNDPDAETEVDIPFETLQPDVVRQVDPQGNPEAYGGFDADWKSQPILQAGTRCVSVLPGKPSYAINTRWPIADPGMPEDKTQFVPLTLFPDGTTEWVTFILTDLPFETELEPQHFTRILYLIVDGRTGHVWMQRAMLNEEVEIMHEYKAEPIMHVDFVSPEPITEANILDIRRTRTVGSQ